jgi:hypothetical protein
MNNMNLRLKAYDLILKTLVCFSMTLILSHAHAAVEDTDLVEDYRPSEDHLVELHVPIEVDAPYKDRRTTHGFMFSLGYENVMLDRYVSILDDATFYQDMFGESEFPVANLSLSYKYNFVLGSLMANIGVGYGQIAEDVSGVDRALTLTKQIVSATYVMDNMLEEPYVAPYVSVGFMNIQVEERATTTTEKKGLPMLMHMQAGVLLQLNWLDESVARKSLVDSGLENTYLDLSVSKYEPSSKSTDPDTSTDYTYGAGIRLEY